MKKVIFISALAIAAAVSCTKSDIVDTKFNEQIGFQTYLGRTAVTKAGVVDNDNFTQFGVYGYYTVDQYQNNTDVANLMANVSVSKSGTAWTYSPLKYWTNATDMYTFLAYAPYVDATNGVATYGEGATAGSLTVPTSGASTVITYKVAGDIANQKDLLYADKVENITKNTATTEVEGADGTKTSVTKVPFTFKHALSRLTVKAKAEMYDKATGNVVSSHTDGQEYDFTFTITNIKIAGKFNTQLGFDLYTGKWADSTPANNAVTTYNLFTGSKALTQDLYDFSGKTTTVEGDKYLMVIPTNLGTETATLTVDYTVSYANATSTNQAVVNVATTDFVAGKAYAIELTFQRDADNAIVFDVVNVVSWDEVDSQEVTEKA